MNDRNIFFSAEKGKKTHGMNDSGWGVPWIPDLHVCAKIKCRSRQLMNMLKLMTKRMFTSSTIWESFHRQCKVVMNRRTQCLTDGQTFLQRCFVALRNNNSDEKNESREYQTWRVTTSTASTASTVNSTSVLFDLVSSVMISMYLTMATNDRAVATTTVSVVTWAPSSQFVIRRSLLPRA